MAERRTARLFRNGRSQAVRLPAEFRFEGNEVFIRRDSATGDVVLSRKPEGWADFIQLTKEVGVPEEFLADRQDRLLRKRKLF